MATGRKSAGRAAAAIVLLAAAMAAHGDESRYQSKILRTLPYRGGTISVEHSLGELVVTPGESAEVAVRATIRASDSDFGQRVQILTSASANGISIRSVIPEDRHKSGNSSYSIDMQILVPRDARLDLKNRFGTIRVSDVRGPVTLTNSQGSITARDIHGPLAATNDFGSISVASAGDDAILRNANGSIDARDIHGALNVTNRFGSIVVASAENVIARNANGSLQLRDIRGSLIAENGFGNLVVASADGPVSITSKYGSIDVRDVGGAVTVRSSFGPIFLRSIGGAIDVQNDNGSIQVEDLDGRRCQPIVLRSSSASLRVRVPAGANYDIDARTTNGLIRNSLPIRATSTSGEVLKGQIGKGGCRMELVNSQGSITIE
jgi:DUF4097 and DUF4098 domain-containing protein YvlB